MTGVQAMPKAPAVPNGRCAANLDPTACQGRPILIVTDAWKPQVNGVVRTLETLGEELQARGFAVEYITPLDYRTIPTPSYPEIRLSMTHWFSLGARIAAARPLAVHIATEGPLGIAARAFCVRRGIPFTTSFHTKFPEYVTARTGLPVSWGYAVIRWFHGPSKGVLVATKSLREELRGWGLFNLTPWTRGVKNDLFAPDKALTTALPLDLPRPIYLYVGRVAVEKNLEAFLSLDLPGSKLIVGDGPARAGLSKKFPNARFVGAKYGDELSAHYAGSDVFVFPSKTDTFGLVVIEALASGLPVAAYPVPGPQDILEDAPDAGVLDDDLGVAARRAAGLDKQQARAHALNFTWDECCRMFLNNLAVLPDAWVMDGLPRRRPSLLRRLMGVRAQPQK